MKNHVCWDADQAMSHLIRNILDFGDETSPRGMRVKELRGISVCFDMRRPLVTKPARNLGYRFAPAEAAWILGGDNRVERIKRYSRFIWEFSDDGFFYQGAYGPKVVDQLSYVCDMLSADPDTRQAVMNIWRENPRPSRDIPCTLSYQFMIREGRLHVIQSMRSSDAWLGYPYDVFNAAMLAGYVMLNLRCRKEKGRTGVGLGTHTMLIGSSHLYEKNWEQAHNLLDDPRLLFEQPEFEPHEFGSPQALVDHLWDLAAQAFAPPDEMGDRPYLARELEELSKSMAGSSV